MANEPDSDVSGEDSIRILNEVLLGKKPAVPDTPAMAAHRKQVAKECERIRRDGHIVDVPTLL